MDHEQGSRQKHAGFRKKKTRAAIFPPDASYLCRPITTKLCQSVTKSMHVAHGTFMDGKGTNGKLPLLPHLSIPCPSTETNTIGKTLRPLAAMPGVFD